jgi:hypothetical protein
LNQRAQVRRIGDPEFLDRLGALGPDRPAPHRARAMNLCLIRPARHATNRLLRLVASRFARVAVVDCNCCWVLRSRRLSFDFCLF